MPSAKEFDDTSASSAISLQNVCNKIDGAARKGTVVTPHARHHERVCTAMSLSAELASYVKHSLRFHKWSHLLQTARVCSKGCTKVTMGE